jgi:hypothetical protein
MCRRLVETQVIEAYEAAGAESSLENGNGHYLMLSGMLGVVEKDNGVGLSRNALKGLRNFNGLGDNELAAFHSAT